MGDVVKFFKRAPNECFVIHDPVDDVAVEAPTALLAKIIDGEIPKEEWDEVMIRALIRHLCEELAEW